MSRVVLLPGQTRIDYGREKAERALAIQEESMQMQAAHSTYDVMLQDNSFDGHRGWGNGLLYTSGKAQRIRAIDEAGLKACYDESDALWEVSLETPTERPEYALESLQLKTDHTLCVVCKDTLNYYCKYIDGSNKEEVSSGTFSMTNNIIHHDSLWSLCVFADLAKNKCFICADIWAKVESTYPDLSPAHYSDYQLECCWRRWADPRKERKIWFVMVNPNVEKNEQWNWQPLHQLSLWPKAQFGHYFDKQGERFIPIRGAWDDCADDGTNDALPTRSLALSWLARCEQNADGNHALCVKRQNGFLPTRLLDVQRALRKGKVCIVLPAEQSDLFEGKGYVTLSHCWGEWGAKNNPVLLLDNWSSRHDEGLAWDLLPRTFQDAFKIASWIGEDWLWIDSLCIIQDSRSDWKKEAAMLDRVYQNAQINISADSGSDSRAGCFSKRDENDITPLELSSKEAGPWQVTSESGFNWMLSATSLSRAWIYRERQLSRRILHFTDKELVWECCGLSQTGFASETLPGGPPFRRVFGGDTKFQVELSKIYNAKDDGRRYIFHQLWNSTCESFSKRGVTFATDLPVILSSLAKEFHGMMPDEEYVCGLWRSTLPESLAWWAEGVKPDDTGFVAPSWSWLNVAIPVRLAVHNRHQHKLPVAEVLGVKVEHDSDPYGPVTRGELQMQGYLRRIRFDFSESGRFVISVVENDENGGDRLRVIGPDWNEYEGLVCKLNHDIAIRLDYQDHECYVFFTTIAEWAQDIPSCERKLTCLLLDAVDGGHNVFRKIGTLDHLSDEYSFKMRYMVVDGPEAGLPRHQHVEYMTSYQGLGGEGLEVNQRKDYSIWYLLAQFIRLHRWIVICLNKKEKERLSRLENREEEGSQEGDEAGTTSAESIEGSESPQHGNESPAHSLADSSDFLHPASATSSSGKGNKAGVTMRSSTEEEITEPRHMVYSQLVTEVRRHTSSGIQPLADVGDEANMVKDMERIMTATKAFGSVLPPAEALYQFDDVLDRWREDQGIIPWLRRLNLSEVILI